MLDIYKTIISEYMIQKMQIIFFVLMYIKEGVKVLVHTTDGNKIKSSWKIGQSTTMWLDGMPRDLVHVSTLFQAVPYTIYEQISNTHKKEKHQLSFEIYSRWLNLGVLYESNNVRWKFSIFELGGSSFTVFLILHASGCKFLFFFARNMRKFS